MKILQEMRDILEGIRQTLSDDRRQAVEDRREAAQDRKQSAQYQKQSVEYQKQFAEYQRQANLDRARAIKRDEHFATIFLSLAKLHDNILTNQHEHTRLLKEILSVLKRGSNGRQSGSNGNRRK